MVCELHLNKNVLVKKETQTRLPALPITHPFVRPTAPYLPNDQLALGDPPTQHQTRAELPVTPRLTHPLTARPEVPHYPGGEGALAAQAQPPRGGPVPHWQEGTLLRLRGGAAPQLRTLTGGGEERVSPNPLGHGAGGPAGLPAHLSQPAGRSASSSRTSGRQRGNRRSHGGRRLRPPCFPVFATPALTPAVTLAQLRLGSRPGRVSAKARRLGEKREATENAARNRTAGRAPAGDHVARGTWRADFWEM